MKYWIGVVSKDHVLKGVDNGIMQIGHGKKAPLARLKKDDWIIYYSPVNSFGDRVPLQSFTALGQVADDEIYQHKVSEDFIPYRRKVKYLTTNDALIRPLINSLGFIKSKTSWGYVFRFGLLEINEEDFETIKERMIRAA